MKLNSQTLTTPTKINNVYHVDTNMEDFEGSERSDLGTVHITVGGENEHYGKIEVHGKDRHKIAELIVSTLNFHEKL
jgi:hypothetical protein